MNRNILSSRDRSFTLEIFTFFMGRIDSDLDGDGPSTNILAFESSDCLLLLLLASDVDKAIAFALPWLSPASADNAGRIDSDAGIGEQSRKTFIIDVESEVGHKQHILGRFTGRVFTSWAGRAGCPGLANTWCFLGRSVGVVSYGSSTSVAFNLCLGLTLNRGIVIWDW